ncbi:MAG: hypothetical protein ACI845_003561 [Gammaproteobacteria bacterium]|jgi:hypothetical protein
MSLLLVVSHSKSAPAFKGLAGACCRNQIEFSCFFTGEGVTVLGDREIEVLVEKAQRAVVCEHSWEIYTVGESSPVETGSQTDHSAMIGSARQVVSL